MSAVDGRSHRRVGFYLGLLATVLVAVAAQLGWLARLDGLLYDAGFSLRGSGQPADDGGQIVHVDIDEATLSDPGRGSSARQRLADLVDELTACGGRAIVLDVALAESSPPRLAGPPIGEFPVSAADDPIDDDRELAQAIARSGRVFLAMHFDVAPGAGSADSPDDLTSPAGRRWALARMVQLLRQDERLSPGDAAATLFPAAGHEAGPIQDVLFDAYWRAVALRWAEPCSVPARLAGDTDLPADWPAAAGATPPIPELVRTAAGVGVADLPGDPDGTVRAVPAMVRYLDRLYPSLPLLVACRVVNVPLDRVIVQRDRLVLPAASMPDGRRGDLEIPLDGRYRVRVNWASARPAEPLADSKGRRDSFIHVPAGRILAIGRNRRLLAARQDPRKSPEALAALAVPLAFGENSAEAADYAQARKFLADKDGWARIDGPRLGEMLAQANQQVATLEQKAAHELTVRYASLRNSPVASLSPDERRLLAEIVAVAEPLVEPGRVRQQIDAMTQAIADGRADLRLRIEGKVCLVGAGSSVVGGSAGSGDLVPTSVLDSSPAVAVHGQLLNTILTGRFLRLAPWWLDLLAVLSTGLVTTLLASSLGSRLTIGLVLAAATALVLADAWILSAERGLWLQPAGPIAAMLVAASAIILYRWWTQGRHRRGMMAALGVHFTPAEAQRLANVPDRLTPGGELREISCLSIGLKDFAVIRERLGPQGAVALLNTYLGCMSDVLLRHEATIDTFHGDTILAFFGAPGPQIDHARRAAAAGLECRAELRLLAREMAGTDTPPLSLRIGIATGPAIVGNCGPAQRFDYGAIGPTVDLAGRLLEANGLLGTSVLVSGPTAAELDPIFLLRSLGRVVVADSIEPVALFELLGRLSDSSDELRCWADGFGSAVELFARRDFAQAAAAFEALGSSKKSPRRDDRPTAIYLARCREAAAPSAPPGDEWSAAIRPGER